MIDCRECSDYGIGLFNRGDIPKEEIEKVIRDRHILRKCNKDHDLFKEWLNFSIDNQKLLRKESGSTLSLTDWNKGYLEALLDVQYQYYQALDKNHR